MKKKTTLIITLIVLFSLAACSTGPEDNNNTGAFDSEEIGTQLATSIYISQGLLESDPVTTSSQFALLSTHEPVVETRMDQMMRYFERINIFISSTPETALDITQSESSLEGYESLVSYQIENRTYTIHYNIVDSNDNDDLEENEFELEGILEYDDVSLDILGGTEVEDGEIELFFETHSVDSDDYVRVEIEKDEFEQYFEIETNTSGEETYAEIRLEREGTDGAVEIYIEENGLDAYYEITKEVDGEFTIYYFEYSIGDTSGSIQLTEYVIDGQKIQHFIIEEDSFYDEYTIPENSIIPDDL